MVAIAAHDCVALDRPRVKRGRPPTATARLSLERMVASHAPCAELLKNVLAIDVRRRAFGRLRPPRFDLHWRKGA